MNLDELRGDTQVVTQKQSGLIVVRPVVIDILEETGLRALSLAILAAEAEAKRFIHLVAAPSVRALIGEEVLDPLTNADVAKIRDVGVGG